MHRYLRTVFCVLVVALVAMPGMPATLAGNTVGSFEIDGNTADDSGAGEPLDWQSFPAGPNFGQFTDLSKSQQDSSFGLGSKELEPGGWTCSKGGVPGKDDIVNGAIAFRRLGGHQFLYARFQRAETNGDAHMDYEFNQSSQPNPNCTEVPGRTNGDLLVTFDTENGGKTIIVRAFRWQGTAQSGTFENIPLAAGVWDGAVNIPPSLSDPGVAAGAFGEAAIDLTAAGLDLDCKFAAAYMKTRASTEINAALKDRTAPISVSLPPTDPDPSKANAHDSAYGAQVSVPSLGITQTLALSKSSQSGVGSNEQTAEVLNVKVPNSGQTLTADVMRTSSVSTVTASPAQADHTSIAETANVNVLAGLVTASKVRAVANTSATGVSTSVSSIGSAFKDLVVNGVAQNNVHPNTRINLPAAVYGANSYVALYEQIESTSAPSGISGGTFVADLTVNMIRVHISGGVVPAADIVISNAVAHSDFPQITLCSPQQLVSGHAFIASEVTNPQVLPVMFGFVDIPATGGHDHQNLDAVNTATATAGVSESDSSGTAAASGTTASSYAQATNVCVLAGPGASPCSVSAQVVKSQANSTANAGGASSNDTGTSFVGVSVMGQPTTIGTSRNQVVDLDGIGFVIFNEQFCDNGAALPSCADSSMPLHSGLTVRAIHAVVTVPGNPLGLAAGAETIVAEAHSDATFR